MSKTKNSSRGTTLKRTTEHVEQQRDRILRDAHKAFIEHGYHVATMSDIACKAGISQGLAYCYFENKYAILEAIVDSEIKAFWDEFRAIDTRQEFVDRTIACLRRMYAPDGGPSDTVLYLELRAEAARDPRIWNKIHDSDIAGMTIHRQILRKIYVNENRPVTDDLIENKSMQIDTLFDGTMAVLARGKHDSPERYLTLMGQCMESILSE
jgi:AcrR family transcriptional regulator